MVFSSITFLCAFLPALFVLYLILPKLKAKNMLLIAASLLFYAWGEGIYVILMIASVFVNWILGLTIAKYYSKRKLITAVSVILNIGMLIVFKYAQFFGSTVSMVTGIHIPDLTMHLPIGISFFTFQILSYVIDVSRDKNIAQKNFFNLLLYISLFPQLIAGPIVKYHDVMEQLADRKIDADTVALGIRRFLLGLSKKILIADALAKVVDTIFALQSSELSSPVAWVGAVFYTLQIYFDFSGYSDMAIGLGHMFGFTFKENFMHPFASKSIKEFWNRWHISLSTWFREYLYIPLGGNRKGKIRTYINLFIVFLVTGLWHGAEFTFVLWGIYNGILVVFERIGIIPIEKIKNRGIRHIYSVLAIVIGFTVFRAESVSQALSFIKIMFTFTTVPTGISDMLSYLTPYILFIFLAACIGSCPVIPFIRTKLASEGQKINTLANASSYVISFILLIVCILVMASNSYSPFIYFRF